MHTRSCCDALGVRTGLDVIARAGYAEVVVWTGERGDRLDGLEAACRGGLTVAAVALPKVRGLLADGRAMLLARAAAARERTAAALCVILGDRADDAADAEAHCELAAALAGMPGPVAVENSGRREERYSDLGALVELLGSAPGVLAALDLGHLAAAGGDAGRLAADRVLHVELHDNDGTGDQHLPLGDGSGGGRSEARLASLRFTPERLVVETDPRCGADPEAWLRALRRDRELAERWGRAAAGASGPA